MNLRLKGGLSECRVQSHSHRRLNQRSSFPAHNLLSISISLTLFYMSVCSLITSWLCNCLCLVVSYVTSNGNHILSGIRPFVCDHVSVLADSIVAYSFKLMNCAMHILSQMKHFSENTSLLELLSSSIKHCNVIICNIFSHQGIALSLVFIFMVLILMYFVIRYGISNIITLINRIKRKRDLTENALDLINVSDDEIVVSDDEFGFNDEGNSDRTLASGDRGLRDEISEITSSSEWTEYDLDSESSEYSENEENNPNTINVQLPVAPRRYELRNRKSNEQPCQPHNNATCDDLSENLKRILEDEQEKRLCVVCRDNNKSVLVLPCKHICLCVDCARKVVEHPNPVRRVCPLCRADIETVMNVFL